MKKVTSPLSLIPAARLQIASISLLLLTLSLSPSFANVPGGGSIGPDVKLTQNGEEVTLDNGVVLATIHTTSAAITELKFKGRDMLANSGSGDNAGHNTIYFSLDGGLQYENVGHCVFSITTQNPDTVDISCNHLYDPKLKDKHPWNADVHFVLRRGATGVYTYVIASHPADYPDLVFGEWRMVWPTPNINGEHLMENCYIDELRHWTLPTNDDYLKAVSVPGAPKEIMKFTTGKWEGKYDSKYTYAAKYWDLGCWGYASDLNHVGAWYVFGAHEYFTDGPNKQDLTATMGLNLVHLNMNHYDGTGPHIKQGQDWQKVYGPYLIYFNDKLTGAACWLDAQAQAKAEAAVWPYAWLNNAAYPLAAGRSIVQGKLTVTDPLKPLVNATNAWIGLAQPENSPEGNFEYQCSGYQYWSRVAADGSFSIPSVRPGTYTLYAYTTGAVGQFMKDNVTIQAGANTNLGSLAWKVPHQGTKIAWEIGIPDRSSAEFKHGNEYFYPLIYWQLPKDFPNPLDYDVDKSNWATDWNYAQSYFLGPDATHVPQEWRIHFRLNKVPTSAATLTVAIASAENAHIALFVNDDSKPLTQITPKFQGGDTLIRQSEHCKYNLDYVSIPPELLKVGENVIGLTQTQVKNDRFHVMYDYLNLELP